MTAYQPEDDWQTKIFAWVGAYRVFIIAGLGLILLIFGGFSFLSGIFEQPKIEVLSSPDIVEEEQKNITVEIAGAINKPGVYDLLSSDRVDRLLIVADGLSADADRGWVDKNINRAARLSDGQKLYIPKINEAGANSPLVNNFQTTINEINKLNINSATLAELDKLPGIGAVRAQAIIDNRPYSLVEELISKKVIPKNVYEDIKDKLIAQ